MNMTNKEYVKPNALIVEFINQDEFLDITIGSNEGGNPGQLSNEASVKPFEDEEDENEAHRNHEVWDDEE